MTNFLNGLKHYIGIALILVVVYFLGTSLIDQYHTKLMSGAVVSTQPTPSNNAASTLGDIVNAVKDKTLAEAIEAKAPNLSASQQTLANTISSVTHVNAELSAALAEGLTKPPPQIEKVAVSTTAASKVEAPAPSPSDDAITVAVKKALNETTVHTDVTTHVAVSWEDKPLSPIFAAYSSDGYSGVGYTFHKTPALNLDGLLLRDSSNAFEAGAGLGHIFKGTSAELGVDATYNFANKSPGVGLFVGVHF